MHVYAAYPLLFTCAAYCWHNWLAAAAAGDGRRIVDLHGMRAAAEELHRYGPQAGPAAAAAADAAAAAAAAVEHPCRAPSLAPLARFCSGCY